MKEKIKQQQAITLIALVITIIILLILAGVTIGAITGDKAIIKEANSAKNSTEMKALEEQIELAIIKVEKNHRNPTMEQVSTEIEKIEHVTRVDRETGDIENDLGDPITGKLDDYLGKKTPGGGNNTPGGNTSGNNTSGGDTVAVPDLKETDVEFIPSKTGWTNESITVTINNKVTGYTLQYSKDGSNWSKYTTPITMDQNGTIKVRLLDEKSGRTGGSVSKGITNIDKLPPNTFTPTAISTTNSITLTGSTTDQTATATNGSSGVVKYYFSKDDGATWEPTEGQAGTSYTFEGLTQNQNFILKMKAVDEAGNEQKSSSIVQSTSGIPNLTESNVVFDYNKTKWTNQDISIAIRETTGSGYKLQYSIEDPNSEDTWRDYTEPLIISENREIYVRLSDGVSAGKYTKEAIKIIDKLQPNDFTPETTSTSNSITITGFTVDKEETETNGSSGIEKYYFRIKEGENWGEWLPKEGQEGTSYTFDGLIQNRQYTLQMKAVDRAGNEKECSTINQHTIEVPGLTQSNITFEYSPSGWYSYKVVRISHTAGENYIIQYSLGDPLDESTWKEYDTTWGVTVYKNGPIYARLKDTTGQVGKYSTGNVTNVDGTEPTVSIIAKEITEDSATVEVTASDSESGLKGTYSYQADKQFEIGEEVTTTANKYTFTGLDHGTDYKLRVDVKDKADNVGSAMVEIKTLKTLYDLEEGNYVKYIDANGNSINCAILYDLASSYGMQVIAEDEIEEVDLGNTDNTENARNAYNNAIRNLNTAATKYLNPNYATSARCVGSVPNNPNSESGYYTNSKSWFSKWNGKFRDQDTNYLIDYNQMTKLNIRNGQGAYWLASRSIDYDKEADGEISFCLRGVYYDTLTDYWDFRKIRSDGVEETLYGCENICIRPVFTLKPTLKVVGGEGGIYTPYILKP